ncbi:uncharacterized protein DFL_003084 [Arthrobotrys flagrans]|uniref:Uncharacterized protein n=1 Tax=Arthrobotrys flagrans TaxID=97331 RepID=A0A437ACT2_ARTFL|nr:hypothetical protein DFL_003084 [Arthrobotrys flagrans]
MHLKSLSITLAYIDRLISYPSFLRLHTADFKEEIQSFLYWSFDGVKRSKFAGRKMGEVIEMAGKTYDEREKGRWVGVPLPAYLRYRLRRFYEVRV